MKALQGQFAWAGSAILLAAVFDVLDGRVARLTKGTSEFGVQYDSLCDLVSFGCAPAVMMYLYGLSHFGRIGWVICFLFMACGALRLARFNVMSSIGKASGDFTGLPIPMAAAVVATFILFIDDIVSTQGQNYALLKFIEPFVSDPYRRSYFMLIVAPFLSLAMVSNVVYRSHKALRIKSISPFKFLAGSVFIISLMAYMPEALGFFTCLLYAASGPLEWAMGWKKPTEETEIFEASDDGEIMESGNHGNHDPYERELQGEPPVSPAGLESKPKV